MQADFENHAMAQAFKLYANAAQEITQQMPAIMVSKFSKFEKPSWILGEGI